MVERVLVIKKKAIFSNCILETFVSNIETNSGKHFVWFVPANVVSSPNISGGYIWTNVRPGQMYLRDMFGLMYESAKHKICNLKNYHNTKSKKLPFLKLCI